ncbi:MAG: ABC transporter ATP-binding protein [Dethiosulfovibrio sp.]|nr:ABC transporter ATP-binding protein [Dethiosulfovibrio sp.]
MSWLKASFKHEEGDFSLSLALSTGRDISVLFGPSGAGKSMTLKLLCGLKRPSSEGIFTMGGRVIQEPGRWVKPRDRSIAMVFQDLALFPHMTVEENVSFAISDGDSSKCSRWLNRMGLESKAKEMPHNLSGGQRQRVALARALASSPELLLLDEPFSALDTPLRRSLRRELKELHRETGIPMIYVTHQMEDVCAMGDRVFLINNGKLSGEVDLKKLTSSDSSWHHLGWGNMVDGDLIKDGGVASFSWRWGRFYLPPSIHEEGPVSVFIPSDRISIVYPSIPLDPAFSGNKVNGRVVERYIMGRMCHMQVEIGEQLWQVEFPSTSYESLDKEEGSDITIAVRPVDISIIPKDRRNFGED